MTKRCFVIMPFSQTSDAHPEQYWTEFFYDFVEPAVKNLGFECIRSSAKPKNIIEGILEELTNADIVLAVLTDNNPNVWYELGTRHALKRGTVMILEEGQSIPFDIQQYGVVFYRDGITQRTKFESKLKSFIEEIENGVDFDSPAMDFFGKCNFRPCWVSDRVQNTPLNLFSDDINRVRERIIIVGQNLFTLTQKKFEFKKKIFSIIENKKVEIDLIICENLDYIARSTAEFTDPDFSLHLSHSIKTFKEWEAEAEERDLPGKITLSQSKKLGSLSLTFLDPDTEHGELLLTPIVQPHATGRTCFWMKKKGNENTFNHYLAMYESMLIRFD